MAKRTPSTRSGNQDRSTTRQEDSSGVTPPWSVVWYTALSLLTFTSLMVATIYCLEVFGPSASRKLPMTRLVVLMLFAGAVGACISNIRKMVKYSKDFDVDCCIWYYLNPLQGAVCGMIVVVLLLGGVLTLSQPQTNADVWNGTGPVMPFVAFAILAGYACNKFTRKLSDLADSAFAVTAANQKKRPRADDDRST